MRGYTRLGCKWRQTASEIVRKHPGPDRSLITDVVMPNMGRPTLVRAARRLRPEMRVIYMSGYAEDAFRRNDQKAGICTSLAKPFGLKQLGRQGEGVLSGAPPRAADGIAARYRDVRRWLTVRQPMPSYRRVIRSFRSKAPKRFAKAETLLS